MITKTATTLSKQGLLDKAVLNFSAPMDETSSAISAAKPAALFGAGLGLGRAAVKRTPMLRGLAGGAATLGTLGGALGYLGATKNNEIFRDEQLRRMNAQYQG